MRSGGPARWAGLLLLVSPAGLPAQEIQLGDAVGQAAAGRQRVELLSDAVVTRAGQMSWVELRFRVDPGLHINSHVPHDPLLIPTELRVEPMSPVKLGEVDYPPGISLRLDVGAGETLSTYQGEFRIRLQVEAAKGDSALAGSLRYQACDAHSCFPPKVLPVRVAVTAR